MSKSTRGLPPSFTLKVPENARRGPVELDDYLDEVARPASRAVPAQTTKRGDSVREEPAPQTQPRFHNVVPMPDHADSFVDALHSESRPAPLQRESGTPQPRSFPTAMRKQLNLRPDTLMMIEELLEQIRRYSGQKDAKASEMFHALVLSLHEARNRLDLQGIKPRGRWGSATARNFTTSLKDAFQDAIADWHGRRRG